MTNQERVERFEGLLSEVKREGMDKLLTYIRKSDFYTAPASTRFHSCHEGGLLEHSLNVFDCLIAKMESPIWGETMKKVGRESVIISALLHDLCKSNFYIVEYKNKKVYSDTGKKSDYNGRFDWVSVPGYSIEDKMPLGHGAKSVIILQQYIKLKAEEIYAICHHMGFSVPKEEYNTMGNAMRLHPFVIALNEADLEATYLMEVEE